MAFLPESDDDRQRRLQQQGSGQQVASGASGTITGGPSLNPQNQQGGPTSSGSFTNLNSYLNANKEQAAGLGQTVAGNVAKEADDAKSSINQTQSMFQQQADQSGAKRDTALVNEAFSDPTKFTQDQDKVGKLTQMRTAQYNGPGSMADVQGYGEAAQKAQKASQDVENTKSEAGRFSLVQDQFGKPSYQRGQQRLDQMLLQNSPEARQSLTGLQQQYSGINDALTKANTESQAYAQQRKADTDAARQDVATIGGNALNKFQTDLQGRTEAERAKQQDLFNRIQKQTKGLGAISANMGMPEMDADVAAALGLSSGAHLYNADLSGVAGTFNPDMINTQRVATADDYNKYSALSKLLGQDPSLLVDPKLAGTGNGLNVNKQAVQDALASSQRDLMAKQADMVNLYRNQFMANHSANDYAQLAPNASREDLGKALDSFVQMQSQYDPEWMSNVQSGTGRGANSGQGQAYRQLRQWLGDYDSINNRTLSTRG